MLKTLPSVKRSVSTHLFASQNEYLGGACGLNEPVVVFLVHETWKSSVLARAQAKTLVANKAQFLPPVEKGSATVPVLWYSHTLQWRETTVHDQLKIAKLPLAENDGLETLGLIRELLAARSIACDQVLEDTSVWWVGHIARLYTR